MSELTLFAEEAPPYVRRPMDFWDRQPWNGLTAVGSFSGCGGSSMGLKMAGWNVSVAIEFIAAAADTYRANFPETHVVQNDVRKVTAQQILNYLGLKRGEPDLFEGSPPCASFSPAGAREKGWGKEKNYSKQGKMRQQTDDLFWEWARLLEGLYPRAFLAENVPGMLSGAALDEYAHRITRDLGNLGYRVTARVLNSANYGVPQERRRLIFVGLREDQPGAFRWPDPTTTTAHTLRQALASVPVDDVDHAPYLAESSMEPYAVGRTWHWKQGHRGKDGCDRCGRPLTDHRTETRDSKHGARGGAERKQVVAFCADGQRAIETKDYFLLTVPDLDRPCSTITATSAEIGAASVTHPSECRKFTPAEAKAISGFPSDFRLTGSRAERVERIGRAVPPPLYRAVGGALAEALRA